MDKNEYIPARVTQIPFYIETPLYKRTEEGDFVLYKPSGRSVSEQRVGQERIPPLFILKEDRITAARESHRGFGKQLEQSAKSGNVEQLKSVLCNLVEEVLDEPRSGAINVFPDTVDRVVWGVSDRPGLAQALAGISYKDYNVALHSINVMALTIGFCQYCKYSVPKTRMFAMAALLHDVGKTEIPRRILKAESRLSDEQFGVYRRHTHIGREIIINHSDISDPVVARASQEHHERLDGSGYPTGTKIVSPVGRLIGMIDCYEVLTNEARSYRETERPINVLKLLKDEAEQGKFDLDMLKDFSYSLIKPSA